MSTPTVETERAAFRAAARDAPPGARVPVEVHLAVDDPFAAFRRARDGGDAAFLETTGGQSGWGYFGVDPVERLTVGRDAVCREASAAGDAGRDAAADDAGCHAAAHDAAPARAATGDDSPTLAALQGWLDGEALARGDCTVPYPCGAIGWLSYDVARELESLPETTVDDRGLPRLQVAAFDRLAAWECPTGDDGTVELRITACPRVESPADSGTASDAAGDAAIDAAYDRGRSRALELVERIRDGDPDVGAPPSETDAATFESECGREAYAERVRTIQEHVRAGDTFQANVAQRLSAPAAVHPVDAYGALRRVNPAPYAALLELPAADLVSASPELLLERDGDAVRTEPIAGTRPRGASDEADAALERELRTDEKERAEHAMLVDLERNDLGTVCRYGSVDVAEYRRVDRYAEVMHLVSLVEGRLRPDATLADAIAAAFPGGTITGAPKPRTMQLIDEVEATRRGPYTGSIGIFGFDGRATMNIVIRTLLGHADAYHLRVGAGIVHDSVPEREYAETLDKARALIAAVDEALGDRTELAVEDGGETA